MNDSSSKPFMVLDKHFRLNRPVSLPSRVDPKKRYTIEHCMNGDAFTIARLVELLGVEEKAKEVHDARKMVLGWVRSYRAYLADFYSAQRIKPIMRFVPVEDEKDLTKIEKAIFIQGFYDVDTLMPVLGDIDTIALALESRNAELKEWADEYLENQSIAKKALALPGIKKDVQNRLNRVVTGSVAPLHLDAEEA